MGARSSAARLGTFVATGAIAIASCGGGSGGESSSPGDSGQAGVVLDTAADVESAVVETTTPSVSAAPDTSPEPDPTAATTPAVTTPVVTTPDVTAPVVTSPDTIADTVPAATEPVSTGVPVGYRPISDDSGVLRANVPAEWLQVDGAPDGEVRQLAAAADLPAFLAGYTLPGMLLVAGDAAIPDAWIDGLAAALSVAEADGCTVTDTSDYDDGVYTGTEHVLSCGTADTTPHLIGGRDADGELFFLLAIVRPADDSSVRTEIVQSFFVN